MREILFRGIKKPWGGWCEGSLVKMRDYFRISTQNDLISFGVETETIGQFTGLTDKNGKKIFEGDIIKYHREDDVGFIGVVKCGEYSPDAGALHSTNIGFYVEWGKRNRICVYRRKDLGFWTKFRKVEVIGNIHDNPELLEG
jgi:uncharacterized phage protein (TIGR01671 family)